jgi:MFS family permease
LPPPARPGIAESISADSRGIRALEWLNFFLADVQTGVGPFLAAYLAASGWGPGRVGLMLTLGGAITVAVQTPAGAIVDRSHSKREVIAMGLTALVAGAVILFASTRTLWVSMAQVLLGGAGPFLAPTIAAITLGMVGARGFGRQFGKNQSFNAAGNVCTALLAGLTSRIFGVRSIFLVPIALAIPTAIALAAIPAAGIDYGSSRGARPEEAERGDGDLRISAASAVLADRVLLAFFVCACLFHLANAAMLPQLGEMLSRHHGNRAAGFMAACVIVTQMVISCTAPWIAKQAARVGRRPLLLIGFGVLPVRGVLYAVAHGMVPLVAIQLLDGVANAIFGVVSILVVADRTEGTGRFNLVQGALATVVGIGAALSTTVGGALIEHFSYRASFLGLAAIAAVATGVLWLRVPETRRHAPDSATQTPTRAARQPSSKGAAREQGHLH